MMIADLINDYGFPIVATVGLGYFVFYIWQWVTTEVKPRIGDANATLIGLIDKIRMLDNDMIRLTQKLEMILEFKEEYEKLTGRKIDFDIDDIEKVKKELADVKQTAINNRRSIQSKKQK